MEIVHQLPGRVRIRAPEIESEGFCKKVIEELTNDDRITETRISSACNSMVVCYDPIRIKIEDLLGLLDGKKSEKNSSRPAKKAPLKPKQDPASKYFRPAVTEDVQEKIKQLIESEDPKKPLSDGRISEVLKKEKIGIARRTVAKYREMMGIPASSKRKQ